MRHRCTLVALALLVVALLSGGIGVSAAPAASDASDAAWATIRARVPAEQPLYRPTWLPDRFQKPGVAQTQGAINAGVGYQSEQGDTIVFVYESSNSCAPTEPPLTEPVLIHGHVGSLTTFQVECSPRITAYWQVNERAYSIQAGPLTEGGTLLSREEMLLIIAGLALVGPDGAALPQPVGSATPGATCFRETGLCAAGPFLDYWRANGGLARNGYPLTGEMLERLEDGKLYQVQYFERVRMEYHPENAGTPYAVLLGQFGRRIHGRVDPPAAQAAGAAYFPETGHNLDGRFRAYWEANGGLSQFGFPISEVITEELEDGKTYQVQYFERARFEHHPENAAPYDVLLGQFGRRILAESAGR